MKLFYWPRSPYTKKILLAAYEKAFVFPDSEMVPPYDGEAMKRLRTEQALATVPLLRLDDGSYLGDSSIIVEYIDLHSSVGPRLVPSDAKRALQVRALDRFAENIIGPTNYLTFALRAAKANQSKIDESLAKLHTALGIVDDLLVGKSFLGADELTLGDLGAFGALATVLRGREGDGVDAHALEKYRHIRSWYERIAERPSWKRLEGDIERTPVPFESKAART